MSKNKKCKLVFLTAVIFPFSLLLMPHLQGWFSLFVGFCFFFFLFYEKVGVKSDKDKKKKKKYKVSSKISTVGKSGKTFELKDRKIGLYNG